MICNVGSHRIEFASPWCQSQPCGQRGTLIEIRNIAEIAWPFLIVIARSNHEESSPLGSINLMKHSRVTGCYALSHVTKKKKGDREASLLFAARAAICARKSGGRLEEGEHRETVVSFATMRAVDYRDSAGLWMSDGPLENQQ